MKTPGFTHAPPRPDNDPRGQLAAPPASVWTRRAAAAAVPVLLAAWHLPGASTPANTQNGSIVMSNLRVKTYETYLAAWGAVPEPERSRLLREALAEDVVFVNATKTRHGRAEVAVHLQEFQQRSPGASFRSNEILGWEEHGHVTWQFVDAHDQPGFAGHDVLSYNGDGLIERILMFVRTDKQLLK